MLHTNQLPCHSSYLIVILIIKILMRHFYKMLIPHDIGHFCPEMDKSEQLLSY